MRICAIVFASAFALSVFAMLRLADLGEIDSPPRWYTIYSATVGALTIAVILAARSR